MVSLVDRNVVVIGGTSGIGLATAVMAKAQGANVWAVGRSEDRAAAAAEGNPGISFSTLDIHNLEALTTLFESIGIIHHVVAAATGANRTMAPFIEQTDEQFREAFNKFWGYCNVIRKASPYMTDDGSITLLGGFPARKCNPGMSAVSCVGNAVEGLSRALAVEMAPRRVNVVAPGTISTGMFDNLGDKKEEILAKGTQHIPLKRPGQSEEVASAVILTLTNAYMTGTTIDIEGGALLP